jgi:hypothetical protein
MFAAKSTLKRAIAVREAAVLQIDQLRALIAHLEAAARDAR